MTRWPLDSVCHCPSRWISDQNTRQKQQRFFFSPVWKVEQWKISKYGGRKKRIRGGKKGVHACVEDKRLLSWTLNAPATVSAVNSPGNHQKQQNVTKTWQISPDFKKFKQNSRKFTQITPKIQQTTPYKVNNKKIVVFKLKITQRSNKTTKST